MSKISRDDIWSLEEYHKLRPEFRKKVMAHKKVRKLPVGPNAMLFFEDKLTMHYQVQEMLRAERIFEEEGIQEEMDTYNALIPDGSNWKVTFMLEFPDVTIRKRELARLVGIEDLTWVQVEGHDKVYPIADEDLERDDDSRTSSVHFLRYELGDDMIESLRKGAKLTAGIEHDNYNHTVDPVPDETRKSLLGDLD